MGLVGGKRVTGLGVLGEWVSGGRLTAGGGEVAGRACPAPTVWREIDRALLIKSYSLTQSLHKRYMFPLDVTGWMVYTVGRRTVLSYYILCQFSIRYLIFMKGAFPMLPCQKNCHAYCPGCHKSCPHFRAMQEQQHRDLIRKKEYLRRADESCRVVLHQCRAAGGYLGPLPY